MPAVWRKVEKGTTAIKWKGHGSSCLWFLVFFWASRQQCGHRRQLPPMPSIILHPECDTFNSRQFTGWYTFWPVYSLMNVSHFIYPFCLFDTFCRHNIKQAAVPVLYTLARGLGLDKFTMDKSLKSLHGWMYKTNWAWSNLTITVVMKFYMGLEKNVIIPLSKLDANIKSAAYTAKLLFHHSPTRHSDYTVTTTVTM